MKERKSFGFGHRTASPGPAALALFCPACPQPGINLPEDWKQDPKDWMYWRSFVADGNFVAVHQFQSHAVDDVWIKNGESFMTERERYEDHLNSVEEHAEVNYCHTCVFMEYIDMAASRVHVTNTVRFWTSQSATKGAMSLASGQ
jgi:hypothetical protein